MAILSLQAGWEYLLDNYSHVQIEFYGTLVVQFFTFWIPSLLYYLIDPLFPNFSRRHKLQGPQKQPTKAEILHCLKVVSLNQLLSTAMHLAFIAAFAGSNDTDLPENDFSKPTLETTSLNTTTALNGTLEYSTLSSSKPNTMSFSMGRQLPGYLEVIMSIVIFDFFREILFYYSHRLLHIPKLYPKIHKKHHKFIAPIALAAQYAHPIEQVVSNVLPVFLPPQIIGTYFLGTHMVTVWSFIAFELLGTTTMHSGYDFFGGIARKHDLHHEKFLIHFGTYGILDRIHGTHKLKEKENKKKQ